MNDRLNGGPEATPGDPLAGASVRDVRQPAAHEVVLTVFRPGSGSSDWVLSTHPECPRLLRTFRRARNAPQPPVFCQWLRTRLLGTRLEAPRLLAPQVLELAATGEDGTRHTLVLEANGGESNLLLLDGERRLLIAMRHPALPGRKLAPGDPYALPVKPRALQPGVARDLWKAQAWRFGADEAQSAEWERLAREQEAGASLETVLRVARQRAKAELKKLRRRLENVREDLQRAEGSEQLRHFGELLKIHRGRLQSGMSEIALPDEFDPARAELTIALDPRMDPARNIERYFDRYRKLRAAVPHIRKRLDEAEAAERAWTEAELGLEQIDSAAALNELFRRLGLPTPGPVAGARQSGKAQTARPTAGGEEAGLPVLSRTSSDGYAILVGRSKEANDRVTFRVANGRDWWFHAQGVPGSHVVVRNPKDGALPERTVREAAWLAAYYSQRRKEGKLDVDYTQRKHVKKIKGGEPGQVTYSQNKTVLVDVNDAALAAVLGEAGE